MPTEIHLRKMYPTDNLQTYFFVVFEERWDSVNNEPEELEHMKEHIADADRLREWCEELMNCFQSFDAILLDAILNSVDWEELRLDLLEKVVNV